MERPEFRLNRIAKEINNPLRNWGVGYTAEVMLQYAKEYHESELTKLRVTDVSGRSEQVCCPRCKSVNWDGSGLTLNCNDCDYQWQQTCH